MLCPKVVNLYEYSFLFTKVRNISVTGVHKTNDEINTAGASCDFVLIKSYRYKALNF